VLRKNKPGHEKLADLLLEREVIFSEDLETIFGKRPWDKKHVIPENGTVETGKSNVDNKGSWDDSQKVTPENKTIKE
jgi:cell division protease FtsH